MSFVCCFSYRIDPIYNYFVVLIAICIQWILKIVFDSINSINFLVHESSTSAFFKCLSVFILDDCLGPIFKKESECRVPRLADFERWSVCEIELVWSFWPVYCD